MKTGHTIYYTRKHGWLDDETCKATKPQEGDKVNVVDSCNGWRESLRKCGLRFNWVKGVIEKDYS